MQKVLVGLFCLLALAGCSANRADAWDEEDAGALAAEASAGLLAGNWLEGISPGLGRPVYLWLAGLDGQDGEEAFRKILLDKLAQYLLASGRVRLVIPREPEMDGAEELPVEGLSRDMKLGGADAVLTASLNSVKPPKKAKRALLLELNLTDARSGELLYKVSSLRLEPRGKL